MYVAPKSLKEAFSKTKSDRIYRLKVHFSRRNCKASLGLCENFQRQSCKAFTGRLTVSRCAGWWGNTPFYLKFSVKKRPTPEQTATSNRYSLVAPQL